MDELKNALRNWKLDEPLACYYRFNIINESCDRDCVKCRTEIRDIMVDAMTPYRLSGFEYGMLQLVSRYGYRYMARGSSSILYFYKGKPDRVRDTWMFGGQSLAFFTEFYSFVTTDDEEPTQIAVVIAKAEVVDE